MSYTETHFGKLRKVETSLTIENWCKNQCLLAGETELASYSKTWEEQFKDTFRDKYFIINDEIWEAVEHVKGEDGNDIDIMIPNEDGTVTFVMQFYNGGTCLSECIEDGLTKLNKQNEK